MDKVQQTNHFEDKSEMIREEEIITASHNEKNYPCCIISDKTSHPIIFQIGAKWADQHPKKGLWYAEKVCKYLEEHAGNFMTLENDEEGELRTVFYQKGLVDNLRKAMEDQQ